MTCGERLKVLVTSWQTYLFRQKDPKHAFMRSACKPIQQAAVISSTLSPEVTELGARQYLCKAAELSRSACRCTQPGKHGKEQLSCMREHTSKKVKARGAPLKLHVPLFKSLPQERWLCQDCACACLDLHDQICCTQDMLISKHVDFNTGIAA